MELGVAFGGVLGFALADGVADSGAFVPGLASSVGELLADGAADALPHGLGLASCGHGDQCQHGDGGCRTGPRPPLCAWPRPVLLLRIISAP